MQVAPCRLVIVGGGIAGVALAKMLGNDTRFAVTLLDRQNHFVFQPLLYQVATSALASEHIAVPIRFLLRRMRGVRVVQAEAERVEPERRRVQTNVGAFDYDVLVVAAGLQSSYFGRDEWQEHAPSLKTLADANRLRERVLAAFERAEAAVDPGLRARELTFVVVGGGSTGVELAGALAELARDALRPDFRQVDPAAARIVLVEAGPRLLGMFHGSLAQSAERFLRARGVELRLGAAVAAIDPAGVTVGTERIEAATVIWAAGVRGASLGATLPAAQDAVGRVFVEPDCSLPGHPEIFVVGDLAHQRSPRGGVELPAVGSVALQQAHHVGRLLRSETAARSRRAFAYFDRGQMATVGRNHAIVEVRRWRLSGRVAWWMWLLVHLLLLAGFRNRLAVLLQWGWSYVTLERGARLILDPQSVTARAPVPSAGPLRQRGVAPPAAARPYPAPDAADARTECRAGAAP